METKTDESINNDPLTMYIKNRRNSSEFKAFGSYQALCLAEIFVVFNPALPIA
jgi:hypothetical protein